MAERVIFAARFRWVIRRNVIYREFPAGWSGLVNQACADAARAAGVLGHGVWIGGVPPGVVRANHRSD